MDVPGMNNLANYGLAGALLLVFLWMHFRGVKRAEERADSAETKCESRHSELEKRIDEHQKFERDTLLPLAHEAKEASKEHAEAIRELTRTLRQGSGGHKT